MNQLIHEEIYQNKTECFCEYIIYSGIYNYEILQAYFE